MKRENLHGDLLGNLQNGVHVKSLFKKNPKNKKQIS